jgi:murein DD-endopeptidase MepM/ murein hydrolase activator NlpD
VPAPSGPVPRPPPLPPEAATPAASPGTAHPGGSDRRPAGRASLVAAALGLRPAQQAQPPAPAPGSGYAWPVWPAVVRARFRPPAHPYGPGHRGVDLAGRPGQPVFAARGGTVVFAGPVGGRGVVSVQHDDGLRTTYAPVRPVVAAGASVAGGQLIGRLEPGLTGCPDPACLHWGVRRGPVEYVDPLVLLQPPRLRLLPVPNPWPDP